MFSRLILNLVLDNTPRLIEPFEHQKYGLTFEGETSYPTEAVADLRQAFDNILGQLQQTASFGPLFTLDLLVFTETLFAKELKSEVGRRTSITTRSSPGTHFLFQKLVTTMEALVVTGSSHMWLARRLRQSHQAVEHLAVLLITGQVPFQQSALAAWPASPASTSRPSDASNGSKFSAEKLKKQAWSPPNPTPPSANGSRTIANQPAPPPADPRSSSAASKPHAVAATSEGLVYSEPFLSRQSERQPAVSAASAQSRPSDSAPTRPTPVQPAMNVKVRRNQSPDNTSAPPPSLDFEAVATSELPSTSSPETQRKASAQVADTHLPAQSPEEGSKTETVRTATDSLSLPPMATETTANAQSDSASPLPKEAQQPYRGDALPTTQMSKEPEQSMKPVKEEDDDTSIASSSKLVSSGMLRLSQARRMKRPSAASDAGSSTGGLTLVYPAADVRQSQAIRDADPLRFRNRRSTSVASNSVKEHASPPPVMPSSTALSSRHPPSKLHASKTKQKPGDHLNAQQPKAKSSDAAPPPSLPPPKRVSQAAGVSEDLPEEEADVSPAKKRKSGQKIKKLRVPDSDSEAQEQEHAQPTGDKEDSDQETSWYIPSSMPGRRRPSSRPEAWQTTVVNSTSTSPKKKKRPFDSAPAPLKRRRLDSPGEYSSRPAKCVPVLLILAYLRSSEHTLPVPSFYQSL